MSCAHPPQADNRSQWDYFAFDPLEKNAEWTVEFLQFRESADVIPEILPARQIIDLDRPAFGKSTFWDPWSKPKREKHEDAVEDESKADLEASDVEDADKKEKEAEEEGPAEEEEEEQVEGGKPKDGHCEDCSPSSFVMVYLALLLLVKESQP